MNDKPQSRIGQFRGQPKGTYGIGLQSGYLSIGPWSTYEIGRGFSVWPESLGRYTGKFAKIIPELAKATGRKPDKNGMVEIVEGYGPGKERGGDIVKDHWKSFYLSDEVMKKIGAVKHGDHRVIADDPFCQGDAFGTHISGFWNESIEDCELKLEIIGTAWENPELLT